MSQEFEDGLSREERQALGHLIREKSPPPFVEEQVVERLRQAKLLRRPRSVRGPSAARLGFALAASLLFFVIGALVGVRWAGKPAQEFNPTQFMLLLRAEAGQTRIGGEEESARVKEYGDWVRQLRREGVMVKGEKLKAEARILRASGDRAAVPENRPHTDREAIAGYFLVGARDSEHAVKIAEGCPHLKYGGTIEVRPIDRFE
jgi:hypothetical protein